MDLSDRNEIRVVRKSDADDVCSTGCVKTHPLMDGDSKRLPRDILGVHKSQ
jgi:hypothetical protein